MATFKLKNDRKESGTIPGIGSYVDGVLENAPDSFENPNFERVADQVTQAPAAPAEPVAPQAPVAPAPAAPVAPAASTTPPQEQTQPQTNTQTEGAK